MQLFSKPEGSISCKLITEINISVRIVRNASSPARSGVLVWRDDHHSYRHWGAQQVDDLLVWQCCHGHLADLHQSAALPQPRLPRVAVGFDVGYDALEIYMEPELTQSVPPQCHLLRLTALSHQLRKKYSRCRIIKIALYNSGKVLGSI